MGELRIVSLVKVKTLKTTVLFLFRVLAVLVVLNIDIADGRKFKGSASDYIRGLTTKENCGHA